MPGDGGNCDAVATVAVVFSYGGGGSDSVGCFVPGYESKCDNVAMVAVVFCSEWRWRQKRRLFCAWGWGQL